MCKAEIDADDAGFCRCDELAVAPRVGISLSNAKGVCKRYEAVAERGNRAGSDADPFISTATVELPDLTLKNTLPHL